MRRIFAALTLLALIALIAWFARGPASTSSIAAQWLLLALASIAVALWLWVELKPAGTDLGDHVQAFSAMFTIVAVFIAAGLYFLEGRDKVRLSFALETSVIRPTLAATTDQVLLTVRVPVENQGERRVSIRCIAIDIQNPDPERPGLRRSENLYALEEMQLVRNEATPIPYDNPISEACIRASMNRLQRRRQPADRATIRPVFMWRTLSLKPGESDDLHFEIPISCAHPFVRILVKLRINEDDRDGYETKTIVPLSDTCAGTAVTRAGVSTPTVGTGAEQPSELRPARGGEVTPAPPPGLHLRNGPRAVRRACFAGTPAMARNSRAIWTWSAKPCSAAWAASEASPGTVSNAFWKRSRRR